MTTLLQSTTVPVTPRRPGKVRRTALVATGTFACLLPTVFAVSISRMLLTGVESDHQFHQATGQGLVLVALWLVPILGLLRAGWRGERPSTALGLQHLVLLGVGAACAVIAPGGGAPALMVVLAVTGLPLWIALPRRPRFRVPVRVHPVLAPVGLLCSAVLVPYAVEQLQLQNAALTGYHSHNPHYFDMAWVSLTAVVLGLVAALLPVARHLVGWLAGTAVAFGAAGLAFGEPTTWSLTVLAVGLVAVAASVATRRA